MSFGWLRTACILAPLAGAPLAGAGCLLFEDEEETPRERTIVLQLDMNPKALDFRLGAKDGEDPGAAAAEPAKPEEPGEPDKAEADKEQKKLASTRKIKKRRKKHAPPPPAGPSLEGLLMRIERVKLERARRGYRPGELPAVDQALARAERLLDGDDLAEALREIKKAQQALDNFQIDRQYIERRLELLNRDPRVSNLSGPTLEKVSQLLDGVNKAYLQGDYRKANKIIDKIRKIIGAK